MLSYFRPWNENEKIFDSYLDYAKDFSLVKYGADTVGKYINQASIEKIDAINQLGQAIGRGMNILSNQMSDINETLIFLNRNMDIQIEQQKVSNLLLHDIAILLRVPDSEKKRQHSIELGVKFFVNASIDSDLFTDALEELLKAEYLMKQDYFVLHRIGCIYLYVDKYLNPEKALAYFLRAAKYASVESDFNALRLANILTKNFKTVNSDVNNFEKKIELLASDSYEKAAFAAYVLGRFSDSVNYQKKALKLNETAQNRFILSKYQVRNGEINEGVNNLNQVIFEEPVYAVVAFKEIDLINEPEVLNLISNKNQKIDTQISKLLVKWKAVQSIKTSNVIKELSKLSKKSYEIKVSQFKSFEKQANEINKNIRALVSEIDSYISLIIKTTFCTFDTNKIQSLIEELIKVKELPLEKMKIEFDRIHDLVDADVLKIGSKYGGGIVFYIDKTGNHGLVCADKDLGEAIWGSFGEIGASGNEIANGSGMTNTKKIMEQASWFIEKGFFRTTKRPVTTAARLCLESNYAGYTDWYLPTNIELVLMYKNLVKNNLGKFKLDGYWSSTEVGSNDAWVFYFSFEDTNYNLKNARYYVRAVRAF